MTKNLYILTISLIIFSCTQTTQIVDSDLDRQAKVTLDSCRTWGKALTSFEVNFPRDYKLKYNDKQGQYVTLTYSDSTENVIQEISFGRNENLRTKEEIEDWTIKMDSALRLTQGFTPDRVYYDKFADKDYYVLKGTFDFGSYNSKTLKGQYDFLSFLIPPTGTEYNGVSFSVITRKEMQTKELADKAESILKTLTFKSE
jgi:hypothetical protein